MKAAILDKNLIGARTGNDHTGEINAGNVALQAVRVANRRPVRAGCWTVEVAMPEALVIRNSRMISNASEIRTRTPTLSCDHLTSC